MSTGELSLWTDDLSVRIQEVDEQHKGLFDLIHQLHRALGENRGKEHSRGILDQLAESTRTHFLLEESLMRLTHYTGFTEHKEQHETLMEQMRTLQQTLDEGGAMIGVDVLHFLTDWLTQHIRSCDQEFSVHFEQAGFGRYANWNQATEQAMQEKRAWWKFW